MSRAALPRTPTRRAPGFIMIYALGILIFITVIALSLAYVLRLDAKLVSYEKTALKTEQTLRGALHYTLAQLARAKALQPIAALGQLRLEKGDALWNENAGPYRLVLDDIAVDIEFSYINPDINLVSRDVLARLLLYIGARDMGEAGRYADIVLAVRDQEKDKDKPAPTTSADGKPTTGKPPTTNKTPVAGFTRMEEVLALEAIPLELRNGARPVKNKAGDVVEPAKPGLAQLFSVASGARTLDANRSDLALVAAFSNAPLDKLLEFDRLRRQKPMNPDEAAAFLGEGAKGIFAPTNTSATQLKLIANTPPYIGRAEAVINLSIAPGPEQIVSFKRLPPGQP